MAVTGRRTPAWLWYRRDDLGVNDAASRPVLQAVAFAIHVQFRVSGGLRSVACADANIRTTYAWLQSVKLPVTLLRNMMTKRHAQGSPTESGSN